MTKLLDRQLFFSYLQSYVICLVSMLSLFIIVDLFANLDNIAENHHGLVNMLSFIFVYYSSKVVMIFDRLSESIVLMAAMFTVAWMQRNNEILPLLSAGVSTRRVVRPVLVAACVMVGVAALNQEFVLPTVDPLLLENKDAGDNKDLLVKGGLESNGISISGHSAKKNSLTIKNFTVVFPNGGGWEGMPNLQAQERTTSPKTRVPMAENAGSSSAPGHRAFRTSRARTSSPIPSRGSTTSTSRRSISRRRLGPRTGRSSCRRGSSSSRWARSSTVAGSRSRSCSTADSPGPSSECCSSSWDCR